MTHQVRVRRRSATHFVLSASSAVLEFMALSACAQVADSIIAFQDWIENCRHGSDLRRSTVHDPGAGVAQAVELAVRVLEVESDSRRACGRRAADLSQLELDAVGNVDAHAMG